MRTEKELIKQVQQRLEIYRMTTQIILWFRLNSGKVKTYYGSYIKLCDKNTPDFEILYLDKDYHLNCLFLECKSDKGRLTKGQEEFRCKYTRPWMFVLLIKDINELDNFINKYAKDPTKEMQSWNH